MILINLLFFILSSCIQSSEESDVFNQKPIRAMASETIPKLSDSLADTIATNAFKTKAEEVVAFAESLTGIRYKYASTDPNLGFDCSGFISYVFNNFDITVPRSSREFTHYAEEIPLKEAKRGDLILFTGTDSTKRIVGHMGIITSNKGQKHEFIHSTSGKAYGVTTTPLNKYYQGRFVKTIRIFKEDEI